MYLLHDPWILITTKGTNVVCISFSEDYGFLKSEERLNQAGSIFIFFERMASLEGTRQWIIKTIRNYVDYLNQGDFSLVDFFIPPSYLRCQRRLAVTTSTSTKNVTLNENISPRGRSPFKTTIHQNDESSLWVNKLYQWTEKGAWKANI